MKEKETKRFGFKRVIAIIFILSLLLTSGAVFAYWANTYKDAEKTDSETIEIGEGQEVTTIIELNKTVVGGKLVPSGRAVAASGQVEEVVLTFDVLWTDIDETSHGEYGELTITPEFDSNPANLLNVVVNGNGAITAGTTKTITLTITLTEPADLAEYDLVANQTFTLAITFGVVPTP